MTILHRNDLPGLFVSLGLTTGAEVGVLKGDYSSIILDNPGILHLWSIDPWLDMDGNIMPALRDKAQRRLSAYGSRSTVVVMKSVDAAEKFRDGSLGFVYIDALHRYEDVMADLRAWFPKVQAGGILAGHDYDDMMLSGIVKDMLTDAHPSCGKAGVVKAVDEFFYAKGIPVNPTNEEFSNRKCKSWWVNKGDVE